MRIAISTLIILTFISTASSAFESDAQIKEKLIKQSVASYLTNVGNCPCPYNRDRVGHMCGKRSAWSKPGGYSPLCYPSDVTDIRVQRYKDLKRAGAIDGIYQSPYGGTDDPGYLEAQPSLRGYSNDE